MAALHRIFGREGSKSSVTQAGIQAPGQHHLTSSMQNQGAHRIDEWAHILPDSCGMDRIVTDKNPLLQRVRGVFAERLGRGRKGRYFPIQKLLNILSSKSSVVN